jgi:hypothetical protein
MEESSGVQHMASDRSAISYDYYKINKKINKSVALQALMNLGRLSSRRW